MITESTAQVEYFGGRSRTARLGWGQQSSWDVYRDWLRRGKSFFVVNTWQPIPLLLGLPDVLAVLGELMNRHESLRTLYHATDRGDAVQEVLAAGSVPVAVIDRSADEPVEFADLVTAQLDLIGADNFDHEHQVPVRFSVLMHQGIPVLLVFGVSHLSADYSAVDVLSAELAAMLQARADGTAVPARRTAPQPAELAAFESSPEGQLLNVEALTHLREQLRLLPSDPWPTRHVPRSPRYRRAELESEAIPVAVRAAARRLRTTTSVVLLAVTTALIGEVVPGPVLPVDLMQGNRGAAGLRHCVTSLNQGVRTAFPLTATSFEELLRHARTVTTAAARHSRYDGRAAAEVLRTEARRRGGAGAAGCQYNDMWSTLPRPTGRRTTEPGDLLGATSLTWKEQSDTEDLAIYLDTRGSTDRIQLSLLADTGLLTPTELERFLYAVEQTVVLLADHTPALTTIRSLLHAGTPVLIRP